MTVIDFFFSGNQKLQNGQCLLGKYGSLVLFKHNPVENIEDPSDEDLPKIKMLTTAQLGRQLCQHVVGMNPTGLREVESNEPNKKPDETKLLSQPFLLDEELTVQEFLAQNNADVLDFVRLECGEEEPQQSKPKDSENESTSNVASAAA